jgi:pimeloyl-ACP methyl ester carboxylesterase
MANFDARGAKTAMTLALRYPDLVSKVVAIDNGPIHLPLKSYFPKYLQGMAKANNAKVNTHLEADEILREYEAVSFMVSLPLCLATE